MPCLVHETGNLGFPDDIAAFTNHANKNYVACHSLALCMLTLHPPKAQNPVFPPGTCQIFAILPKFLQNLCWIFAGWASIKPRTAPWSPKQQLIEFVQIFSSFSSLIFYLFPFLCLGLGPERWNSRGIKPPSRVGMFPWGHGTSATATTPLSPAALASPSLTENSNHQKIRICTWKNQDLHLEKP